VSSQIVTAWDWAASASRNCGPAEPVRPILGRIVPVRPPDTTPEAHALQLDLYRKLGGPARVAMLFRLSDAARRLTMAGIRARHPEYTADEVKLALARLTLGDQLVRQAWPDAPLVDP